MKELGITKGECICKNERIYIDNTLIATCWFAGEVDETRLKDESWLDMRNRTVPEREELYDRQPKANAALYTDAHNTAQKCGLLPSELLRQRDELKEALEYLMEGIRGLPPLTAIVGVLEQQYIQAEVAIKNTEG